MTTAEKLAKQQRRRLQTLSGKDARALVIDIVAQLDGVEWSPDTLDAIASLLRARGFTIAEANTLIPGTLTEDTDSRTTSTRRTP